jgi:HK97 family phage major capsid protein
MSKTKLELIDQRNQLIKANEELIKEGKDGVRSLTDEEQTIFDQNKKEIADIQTQLSNIESLEAAQQRTFQAVQKIEPKKERFSLLRCVRHLAEGKSLHDADQEVLTMGEDDFRRNGLTPDGQITLPMVDHRHPNLHGILSGAGQRADILAGTATQGAEIVATDVLNLLGPLRAALVFSRVGATYLTGLVGNVDIPKYAGSTAVWKGEVADATDVAGAHSELSMTPMRITGYIDVSKRYLIQDAAGAEELLKMDLIASVAGKLESTALSKTAASAGVNPAGLLPDDSDTFSGDALVWKDIVDIEAAVDAANALEGNLAYITHPTLRGFMKYTPRVASTDSRMIMEGETLNGYPCLATSNMSKVLHTDNDEYGLVFANWRHFLIAQWGGMDLVVDPYSLANTAQVRITVNSYWDFLFRHSGAMAFGTAPIA